MEKQSAFNEAISALNLTDIHNVRPILDGKELCTLYGVKPGKLVKPLLDELISFQILHPQASKDDAEAYLMGKKGEFLAKHADGN